MKRISAKQALAGIIIAGVATAMGCQKDHTDLSDAAPPPLKQNTAMQSPRMMSETPNSATTAKANQSSPAVMNIGTVAPPKVKPLTTIQSQPAPPAAHSYRVRKGDTLWSIAKHLLGDGQKWQEIVAPNPGLNPKKLPVGKAIVIPAN